LIEQQLALNQIRRYIEEKEIEEKEIEEKEIEEKESANNSSPLGRKRRSIPPIFRATTEV
jgi:hypothetical protein